jgi:hypothetical protein
MYKRRIARRAGSPQGESLACKAVLMGGESIVFLGEN